MVPSLSSPSANKKFTPRIPVRFVRGSEFFVAEGDESDGTIRCFHPEHILVLNIEPEHLDFYEDLTESKGSFIN